MGTSMSDADIQHQLDILDYQGVYVIKRERSGATITLADKRKGMIIVRASGTGYELVQKGEPVRRVKVSEVAHTIERSLR